MIDDGFIGRVGQGSPTPPCTVVIQCRGRRERIPHHLLIINDETTKSMQGGNGIYNFTYHEGPQWLALVAG